MKTQRHRAQIKVSQTNMNYKFLSAQTHETWKWNKSHSSSNNIADTLTLLHSRKLSGVSTTHVPPRHPDRPFTSGRSFYVMFGEQRRRRLRGQREHLGILRRYSQPLPLFLRQETLARRHLHSQNPKNTKQPN